GVGNDGNSGCPLPLTQSFVAAEEESPIFEDWSADRATKLIAFEFRQPRIAGVALPVKKVSRIQIVIAEKLKHIAVECVTTRFAGGGDDAAGVAPVLRVVCAGKHAKLPQHLAATQAPRRA